MKKSYGILILCGSCLIISSIIIPIAFNISIQEIYEQNYSRYEDGASNYSFLNIQFEDLENAYHANYDEWGSILIRDLYHPKNRQIIPTLHNFRYCYLLLSSEDSNNISRANKILSRMFTVEVAKFGSVFAQSFFNGYNGYGGFHERFPKEVSGEDNYILNNSYFVFRVVPYLSMILQNQKNNVNVETYLTITGKLSLIVDSVIRNVPQKHQIGLQLERIAALLSINSQLRSWNLNSKAIESLIGLYNLIIQEDYIEKDVINYEISQNMHSIISSLYLIQKYSPDQFVPIVNDLSTRIVNSFKEDIESPIDISSTDLNNNNPSIDLVFFSKKMPQSIISSFSNFEMLDESTSKNIIFQNEINAKLPYILLMLFTSVIFVLFLPAIIYPKFNLKQIFLRDNKHVNKKLNMTYKEALYPPINHHIEYISSLISPIVAILIATFWHYDIAFYIILFILPITFLYGFRDKEDTAIICVFGVFVIYSINIFSLLSYSTISLVLQFVFIWSLDIIHTGILLRRLIRGEKISHGYHIKSMKILLALNIAIVFMFFYLFVSNNFITILPNFFAFSLVFKSFVILRAKYG